uniref:Uncharacterized protein n=1 Tax=Rhizophora mucronata TaxID=61149 RepID=A0A2P2QCX5_RHIMU
MNSQAVLEPQSPRGSKSKQNRILHLYPIISVGNKGVYGCVAHL